MKRLLKPWIFALTAALCLHAGAFIWFKDSSWSITYPTPIQTPNFEVSLLPAKPDSNTVPQPDREAIPEPSNPPTVEASARPTISVPVKPAAVVQTAKPTEPPVLPEANTPAPRQNFSLDEIVQVINSSEQTDNWKSNSLLDIGQVKADRPKIDPSKDPFSPKFRQAIVQAKNLQAEYAKGIIEQTEYPITEDADGTRYVNIKGICWKLPKPGSREEWQVVLSGCSGQKQTFRFELNITTDILRSDLFEDLHFGARE